MTKAKVKRLISFWLSVGLIVFVWLDPSISNLIAFMLTILIFDMEASAYVREKTITLMEDQAKIMEQHQELILATQRMVLDTLGEDNLEVCP